MVQDHLMYHFLKNMLKLVKPLAKDSTFIKYDNMYLVFSAWGNAMKAK